MISIESAKKEPNVMKAVGLRTSLPIDDPESLIDFECDKPVPGQEDLLVEVKAVSVNPVDYKVRQQSARNAVLETPKILGWDAAGIVAQVGAAVTLFAPGDEVFYAGDINRAGSNAAYQVVDARIVGRKPRALSYAEAAAIPLTGLTAWEAIFDRLAIASGQGTGLSVLVIGGAGGVGSMAIQLLKQLTHVTVIATASRTASSDWCRQMGADVVVDHRHLEEGLRDNGYSAVDYILNFVSTDQYWAAMGALIAPQGRICSIVPSEKQVDLATLFQKSASFSWELMYTRPIFQTKDMIRQHHILNELAALYDQRRLKPTLTRVLSGLSAANFKAAHAQLESRATIGKVVVDF
jgi:NADPH2:quinone reductase